MTKGDCHGWDLSRANAEPRATGARSSFHRGLYLIGLLLVAAGAGCRGSAIDVAKGKPTDPETNFVQSDNDEEPKEATGWEALTPQNIHKSLKKSIGLGPNREIAQQEFDDGEKKFAAKDFDAAAKLFAKAVDRWPDSALEEDAMFLQAECYFFTNRYSAANDEYGELLKKYPNTRHLNFSIARQFAIARFWQDLDRKSHRWALVANFTDRTQPMFDTRGHAINAFDNVRVNDPRGPLADSAIMAVAQQYYLEGRFEDADYYFTLLRTDYPKSNYQYQAHLLGIQCKLQKYQGPIYNSKPIEEANQLIDQTMITFSKEMMENKDEFDRLTRAKSEIKAQQATREIQLAQYFDKGDHYGAAKIYYAQVLKDYPQTQFADDAKTRLAELQGKPDNPPNRIAALTKWISPAGSAAAEEEKAKAENMQQQPGNTPQSSDVIRQ